MKKRASVNYFDTMMYGQLKREALRYEKEAEYEDKEGNFECARILRQRAAIALEDAEYYRDRISAWEV